jgi:tartrate dehydratase beta subunit/fumarate hydratase class I family protein
MGKQIKEVCEVHFLEELGKTEATWVFRVENFGPFFVAIDSQGNNYFEILNNKIATNTREIETILGIPENYAYTSVSAEGVRNI